MSSLDAEWNEQVEFALDEPRNEVIERFQITEDRRLLFSGWSFAASGAAIEIAIRVAGQAEQILNVGRLREDVGRVHSGVRHASLSGFADLVPLPSEAGPVRCEVEVRSDRGRRKVADFEIDLPPLASPIVRSAVLPSRRRSGRERGQRKAPMRVLFVSHTFNLEGAPRSLFEMARGLPKEQFEAKVVSPAGGPLGLEWEKAGFEKRILPVEVRVGGRDDFEALVRRLAGLLSVEKPDLIVANTLDTFWAVHVAKELGVPAAWIVRESEEPSPYFHTRLPTSIAECGVEALQIADRVVFVAEATRALFMKTLDPSQTAVIYNGLDLDRIDRQTRRPVDAVRSEFSLAEGMPLLLCVGTPCMRKGQIELLEAMIELRKRGVDFHGVFLGVTEGDYLTRMRSLIADAELSKQVDLVPPTSEPLPYFGAADLLVCPSYQESLPRVVLEAMALSRPIVATRVFGVSELIRDDQEGKLVPAGDVMGLAGAIESMLGDAAKATDLGGRARQRAEASFTLDRCVEGYSSLFKGLLEHAAEATA